MGKIVRKIVMFDMQDRLEDKIDKLTSMMSKLTAQGNNQNKQLKSKDISKQKERTNKKLSWSV